MNQTQQVSAEITQYRDPDIEESRKLATDLRLQALRELNEPGTFNPSVVSALASVIIACNGVVGEAKQ